MVTQYGSKMDLQEACVVSGRSVHWQPVMAAYPIIGSMVRQLISLFDREAWCCGITFTNHRDDEAIRTQALCLLTLLHTSTQAKVNHLPFYYSISHCIQNEHHSVTFVSQMHNTSAFHLAGLFRSWCCLPFIAAFVSEHW